MIFVNCENQHEYPVPLGSLVRSARWVSRFDVAQNRQRLFYKIRVSTEPLPEEYWPMAAAAARDLGEGSEWLSFVENDGRCQGYVVKYEGRTFEMVEME